MTTALRSVTRCALPGLALCALLAAPSATRAAAAEQTFEALSKNAVKVYNLKRILRPFVATCDREKDNFKRLFCSALNERLKAQHQAKIYSLTVPVRPEGPLVATFKPRPKPTVELEVRGCLTCGAPMLPRAGGDISKGRFFVFKVPERIRIRRGRNPYDLGPLEMASYTAALPPDTTPKSFKEQILPHLRLELLFRPVAGVTRVPAGRYTYGVVTFELLGHRVVHKCTGKAYGAQPKMAKAYVVDKNDLTCPQNQPHKAVVKATLPATLPREKVKQLMETISLDLRACYEMFGVGGRVPTDVVVSPDGKVRQVKVVGELAKSPTGQCVERMVKQLTFPKFSGDDARLQWPFVLSD